MGLITLEDIRLRDYTLDNLPHVRRLREKSLNAEPEICIERARHVTGYLKEMSSDEEQMETRYAERSAISCQ